MADQVDFSLQTAFDAVCMFGNSHQNIDVHTLKQFLRHIGHQPVKQELLAIVRRLDLDGDNEIGPNEFAEALSFLVQEPK